VGLHQTRAERFEDFTFALNRCMTRTTATRGENRRIRCGGKCNCRPSGGHPTSVRDGHEKRATTRSYPRRRRQHGAAGSPVRGIVLSQDQQAPMGSARGRPADPSGGSKRRFRSDGNGVLIWKWLGSAGRSLTATGLFAKLGTAAGCQTRRRIRQSSDGLSPPV
jgi:hypothetical protein